MKVGDRIRLFKNVNLKKHILPYKVGTSECLEDPSKGNVFKKYDGIIVKIFEYGEVIGFNDLQKYSCGNEMVKRSFESHRSRKCKRVVAEFKGLTYSRFRIIPEIKFKKTSEQNIFGYAEVLPNSIQFIMKD